MICRQVKEERISVNPSFGNDVTALPPLQTTSLESPTLATSRFPCTKTALQALDPTILCRSFYFLNLGASASRPQSWLA